MEDINKIMKTYKEEQKRLTKTKKDVNLEKKDQEISSSEIDIKRQIMHIERLKEERENYRDAVAMDDIAIREEYDKNIKNEEDRLEKQKNSLEDLKKEKNILAINNGKKNEELKKKILQKMNENQDKLRKDLTAEQNKLEIETKKLKVQYDVKMIEIQEFKYQYDEKGVPTNGEEYRKMNEQALKIHEDMKKCEENIGLCKKELEKSREVISDMPKLSKYEIYDESVLNKNIEKVEVSKEAKSESKSQENKVESKEKNKEDISEKIKKVEEEMKAEDRNYGAIHFNVDPKINKVNLKEEKEESPKKEETHTKAEQKIDDSQDNKTKEEYTKRKNDINDNSIESSEDKEEKLDVKIEIGRTGKIKLNGKEYKVGKNIIKEGLNISEDEIIDMLKQKLKYESPKLEDIIRKGIKQKIIDSSVVNAIVSSKMEKEDEYQVLSEYIANAINAEVGKEYKNNCNVTYNKEDLSKANFLTRILKREINANEKVEMLHRAMVGERYATAISIGEYKPDLFSRIVSRVTGNKIPLLSQKIDRVQKVATVYNDLRDENKVNDKEKFRQELKTNIRVSRFSDEQRKELEELRESQVKQEETER